MRFLFMFILLIVCLTSFVQAQEKYINGRIILDIEDDFGEGIYITNTRTDLTTVTDATGSFKIKVQANDVLLIRSINYENRKFTITESLMKRDLITIHLNLQAIVLDEAIITQKLTGFLDKDAKYSAKMDNIDKLYQEMGVNKDAVAMRDTTDFQFGKDISLLHLNVEKVIDSFTGDLRRRKNLHAFEGRQNKINAIKNYFGVNYFIEDLKIPEEKINDFILYAYGNSTISQMYDDKNYLSIMIELHKLAPQYLSRLKPWYIESD